MIGPLVTNFYLHTGRLDMYCVPRHKQVLGFRHLCYLKELDIDCSSGMVDPEISFVSICRLLEQNQHTLKFLRMWNCFTAMSFFEWFSGCVFDNVSELEVDFYYR